MKIAALADLHLGFRQFTTTKQGRNARELDVLDTWKGVVKDICDARPDIITIAGDVFHRSRVSNHAILGFLDGIRDLLEFTEADIHIVQGNHEASRSAEVMSPNELAYPVDTWSNRVWIHRTADTYYDPADGYALTALPFETGGGREFIFPQKKAGRPSILVIHAPIRAPGIPKFYADETCRHIDDLAPHFDYILAGDLHDMTSLVLQNEHDCVAFYSGSIDYTSNNIWADSVDKGWVLVDTMGDTLIGEPNPTVGFRKSPKLRPVHSPSAPVETAEELNEHLRALDGSDMLNLAGRRPIVRLTAPQFDKTQRASIDQAVVKRIKRKCLHFELDLRYRTVKKSGDGTPTFRPRSLRSLADEFFEADKPPVRARALSLIDERWAP